MIDEVRRASEKAFESYKKHFGIVHPSGIHSAIVFSDPFAERLKRYDIIGEPKTKLEIFETLANWFNHTAKFKTITRTGAHVQEINQLHENNAVIIWGLNDEDNKIIFDYCFNFGRF